MSAEERDQVLEDLFERLIDVEMRIEDLIRTELTRDYQMNIEFDKDEGGIYMERDEELLDAFEKLIEYYSSAKDYNHFVNNIKPMRQKNADSISR